MPAFYKIQPQPVTRKAAETFEHEVMIRRNNRFLVATVYLDMTEIRWAVAFAYNPSRSPGLNGHEHLLEVRYSYEPRNGHRIAMFRSDPPENTHISCNRFLDQDSFAQYAITYERELVNRRA